MAQAIASIPVTPGYIKLIGGLDETTPPYERAPGLCRVAQNFEADISGGYATVEGYERFDGRAAPSAATYTWLPCTSITGGAVGNTLTGAAGATGVIIAVTADGFALTSRNGTAYVAGENLNVGAGTIAVATTAGVVGGAATALLNAQYLNLAADVYRALIGVPTGSGKILGGFYFNDVNYCFRNDAPGTAAGLWKSSGSGWTAVTLFNEVGFTTGGATQPAEGATLTQGANTALIKRVVLTSGSWAANTAAGRLIVSTPAPGAFAAGAATVGAINVTLSGAQTAITLAPSGRYETVAENFGGSVNTRRVYGCDGVNRGFEFDGTVFVPISTGMTADTPSHVFAHKKQLFFSFGASVQHAAPGTPYIWSAVLGATELGMGDTVTGFAGQPGSSAGGALAIFTRNRLSVLYGSGVSDWNLVPYRDELGAWAWTIQDVGYTMFLDDRGITNIQTSQEYGNFAHNAITNKIQATLLANKTLAIASSISREKSQYRIFFTNKKALYITVVGKKVVGIMPQLFTDTVRCTWTAETNAGEEVMFFGGDDGYVYQMDKGTSFDGDEIEFAMELAYNFFGSPRVDKSYFDATLETAGTGYAAFSFGYSLGYESSDIPQPMPQSAVTSFSASIWDSFTWDAFVWDGRTLFPTVLGMDGAAENVSLGIRGSSDYYSPLKFTAAIVHYAPRIRLRP